VMKTRLQPSVALMSVLSFIERTSGKQVFNILSRYLCVEWILNFLSW
jgi:hypothetical protein